MTGALTPGGHQGNRVREKAGPRCGAPFRQCLALLARLFMENYFVGIGLSLSSLSVALMNPYLA